MKLLTVSETAEILKLSNYQVYTLIKKGILPSVRIGKSIRIIQDDLEQWIRTNENNKFVKTS